MLEKACISFKKGGESLPFMVKYHHKERVSFNAGRGVCFENKGSLLRGKGCLLRGQGVTASTQMVSDSKTRGHCVDAKGV
jgi:hypothetical protein